MSPNYCQECGIIYKTVNYECHNPLCSAYVSMYINPCGKRCSQCDQCSKERHKKMDSNQGKTNLGENMYCNKCGFWWEDCKCDDPILEHSNKSTITAFQKKLKQLKVTRMSGDGWFITPPVEDTLNELCKKHNDLLDYLSKHRI